MSYLSPSRRGFLKAASASAIVTGAPRIALGDADSFPQNFKWGAACSAPQVESRKGRGQSNWDVFADQKGHIADGSTNATNTEFESRFSDDFQLLSEAGLNAFRFSFSWPRIQPDGPGKPSAEGLSTYDRIIDGMLQHGMEPMATMFHWDVPVWAGDFRDRDISDRMAEHSDIITRQFGYRISFWLALNEPNSVALAGYALAIHAPGLASREAAGAAVHHQNLAQGKMIAAARANLPREAQVSTTINLQPSRPLRDQPEDIKAADYADAFWNRVWLDPLFGRGYPEPMLPLVDAFVQEGDMDIVSADPAFIGMNYYSRSYIKAAEDSPLGFLPEMEDFPEGLPRTQMLPVEPDGLTEMLMRLHDEYGAPDIYITETGFALDDPQAVNGIIEDPERVEYLKSYLLAAQEAVNKGARLKGIFYWAGTDNWEWAEGFSKNYGLIQVDRDTQKRTPKSSLDYYSRCIRLNGVA